MSREAMKLALEALEIIKASCREGRTAHAENVAAIAQHIIKEALEQPEQEPVAWTDEDFTELIVSEDIAKDIGATVPLYTSPPETAELLREIAALSANALDDYKMIQSLMAEREPEPVIDKSAAIRIATSLGWTPKREWQGLTDEEIDEGQRQSWVEKQAFESAVWWAEAKLKEKNR